MSVESAAGPGRAATVAGFASHRLNNLTTIMRDLSHRLQAEPSLQDPELLGDVQTVAEDLGVLARLMRHASTETMRYQLVRLRQSLRPLEDAGALQWVGDDVVHGSAKALTDLFWELVAAHSRGGQRQVSLSVDRCDRWQTFSFVGNPQRSSRTWTRWLRCLSDSVAEGHGGRSEWSEDNAQMIMRLPRVDPSR